MYFVAGHYRQPLAFSADALDGGGGARRARPRADAGGSTPRAPRRTAWTRSRERFFDALADDFNTAGRRAVLFEWVAEANRRLDAGERARSRAARRDAPCASGWSGLLDGAADEAPDDVGTPAAERREAARSARDFERGRPAARRAGRARLGGPRHPDGAAARARRVIVYGRNPVREALRGRRRVRADLGAPSRRPRGLARATWTCT